MSVASLDTFNPPHAPVVLLPDGRSRPPLRMSEEEFADWTALGNVGEWVDGEVIRMSAESLLHVELNAWLSMLVRLFVDRRQLGGRVTGPGYTVRLPNQRVRRVPDLLYVSREHLGRVGATLLEGPPDLSIEIVSVESQSRDRREKYTEYEGAGVREYWIVDPLSKTVEAYAIDPEGHFQLIAGADDGRIASVVLPGFYLRPEWLWQEPLPDVIATLRELGIQF